MDARHPLHEQGVQLDPTAPVDSDKFYAALLTEKTVFRRANFGTNKPFTHAWGLYYGGKLLRWGFASSFRTARSISGKTRARLLASGCRLPDLFDLQIVRAVEVL
jgi:hypothetical protein